MIDQSLFDSKSSIQEDELNSIAHSMHLCCNCEKSLLTAYTHCLCKPYGGLPSIRNVDEVADAAILVEPPYFEYIKQPKLHKNEQALIKSTVSTVAMPVPLTSFDVVDGYEVTGGNCKQRQRGTSNAITEDSKRCQQKSLFSGLTYKSILAEKNHTIESLSIFLQESKILEKNEHENVTKLQQALTRSVKYAAFAEEWHQEEIQRLQQDVRFLKAQYSSMLAYLFQSEESKKQLYFKLKETEKLVVEKENVSKNYDDIYQGMKNELHKSYKQFLNMKETLDRLKGEADTGNAVVKSRNEILQKQLESVTTEYDATVREIAIARQTIKELEFELKEVILQFNNTGDELNREKQNGAVLLDELVSVKEKFRHLDDCHQTLCDKAKRLQVSLDSALELQKQTKEQLEAEKLSHAKESAEARTEVSRLKDELFSVNAERMQYKQALEKETKRCMTMERELGETRERLEQVQHGSDSKIVQLEDIVVDLQQKLKKITESNEQLFKKAAEVKLSLDKEVANTTMLQFEMVQLRKVSEEKRIAMEEQVEKLNLARQSLLLDKKALCDKLKAQGDEFEEQKTAWEASNSELQAKNANLEERNTVLQVELSNTEQLYSAGQKKLRSVEQELSDMQEQISSAANASRKMDEIVRKFKESELSHLATIDELQKRLNDMIGDIATLQREKSSLQEIIESQGARIQYLEGSLNALRDESVLELRTRDERISLLEESLAKMSKAKEELEAKFLEADGEREKLKKHVLSLRQQLLIEATEREAMSTHVEQLTKQLHLETMAKAEIEKTQTIVAFKRLEKCTLSNLDFAQRALKIESLSYSLGTEINRLSQLDNLVNSVKEIVDKPFSL